jgi:hypothetical protein
MMLSQVHSIIPIHGRRKAITAITATIETISRSRIALPLSAQLHG